MKTMGWLALGIFAVAAVGVLTGFRGGCGHGRFGPGGPRPEEMAAFITARVDDALDDIDATAEQRAKIHAVKDRVLAKVNEARGAHGEVHDAFLAEWNAATPDTAKLHALVDQRAEAMKAMAHAAVDAGAEVHGILTPEQRQKLAERLESRRNH